MKIGYLGPAGTFTHQATLRFAKQMLRPSGPSDGVLRPVADRDGQAVSLISFGSVGQVFEALQAGEIDYGVAAIDNTVEGPVLATIDGLLHSEGMVAVGDIWLPIVFDAYALADGAPYQVGVAHPHALAQVTGALRRFNLVPLAAASNGAALENLMPGQVAFGPPGYRAYGVISIAENVGDYPDAETQFVLLQARNQLGNGAASSTMLAITPGNTGPGVLARITAEFAQRGLNLSALFSRPIKGVAKQYVFIVTVDAGPGSAKLKELLTVLASENDDVKILGYW